MTWRRPLIDDVMRDELARGVPATRLELCRMVARVSWRMGTVPADDRMLIDAAHGMAVGIFEDAFTSAPECARLEMIDLCERALRETVAAATAPRRA